MRKLIPITSFLFLAFLQVIFLLAIFFEKISNFSIGVFILISLVVLGIGYINTQICETDKCIDSITQVFFVLIGAVGTYFLSINLSLGAVIASGVCGTLGSFLPLINKKSEILKTAPVALYCGSFVGMSSPLIAKNIIFVALAGLIAGLIYIFSKNVMNGFGGKLGTIAFGAVFVLSLFMYLFTII